MNYLIDTCVLSELVKSEPERAVLDWLKIRNAHDLYVSAITLAELARGIARLPPSKRQTHLLQWLKQLENGFDARVLVFDQHVAHVWAEMMVFAESKGKSIAAFDSMIAATAQRHGCTLVTRNVRDFAHAGIPLLNPWDGSLTPL